MEVEYSRLVPAEFVVQKGVTHETVYIYTGFGKYDAQREMLMTMKRLPNGNLHVVETPHAPNVIGRGFHTELVRVTVYSENPRIWKEELSPVEIYFFKQVKQADSA
jgi:hypothetical protein